VLLHIPPYAWNMLKALLFLALVFLVFALISTIVGFLVGVVWMIIKWGIVIALCLAVFRHFTKQKA